MISRVPILNSVLVGIITSKQIPVSHLQFGFLGGTAIKMYLKAFLLFKSAGYTLGHS